jgi:hypothetical protein
VGREGSCEEETNSVRKKQRESKKEIDRVGACEKETDGEREWEKDKGRE